MACLHLGGEHFLAEQRGAAGRLTFLAPYNPCQGCPPPASLKTKEHPYMVPNSPPAGSTATAEDYWVHLPITSEVRQEVSKEDGQGHR